MWFVFIIDAYLDHRQLKVIVKSTYADLNEVLKSHFSAEKFLTSQSYATDKMNYGIFAGLYEQIKNTLYIILFVTPWFWAKSGEIAQSKGFEGEYYQTIVFLLMTTIFETIIGRVWTAEIFN
jgi:hypothetical protein